MLDAFITDGTMDILSIKLSYLFLQQCKSHDSETLRKTLFRINDLLGVCKTSSELTAKDPSLVPVTLLKVILSLTLVSLTLSIAL